MVRTVGLTLVMLMMSSGCLAKEVGGQDVLPTDTIVSTPTETLVVEKRIEEKKEKKSLFRNVSKIMGDVSNFFMGCDTTYITPQLYEFTTQIELSSWDDYYHMRSYTSSKSMDIKSESSYVLGGFIYWGFLGYGYSVNLRDIGVKNGEYNGTGRRQSLVLNTGRFFAEYYTFNSGKTAHITHLSGQNLDGLDTSFKGLKSECSGLNFSYIFNHNRYSWPAAFGQNAVQRKSCGTWKAGFTYNQQQISLNERELPPDIKDIDSTLLFNHVNYTDYAINFGYAYNWVFKRNCLFAISVTPAIGYRKSNIMESDNSRFILRNISTDLFTKVSVFWNNTRYFVGVMGELHTYHYRKKHFGLTNNYGTFRFIVGLNFLKKSQYKDNTTH